MKKLIVLIGLAAMISSGCGKAPVAADWVIFWTAPGDDGDVGTAAAYDIRISTSLITAANFDSATPMTSGVPTPSVSGSDETYAMPPLSSGQYYVAIKTRDDAFNWSAISNVLQAEVDNIEPSAITDLR